MDGAAFYVLGQGGVAHKPLQLGAGVLEQAGPLQGLLPARSLCGLAQPVGRELQPAQQAAQLRQEACPLRKALLRLVKGHEKHLQPRGGGGAQTGPAPAERQRRDLPRNQPQGLRRQQGRESLAPVLAQSRHRRRVHEDHLLPVRAYDRLKRRLEERGCVFVSVLHALPLAQIFTHDIKFPASIQPFRPKDVDLRRSFLQRRRPLIYDMPQAAPARPKKSGKFSSKRMECLEYCKYGIEISSRML